MQGYFSGILYSGTVIYVKKLVDCMYIFTPVIMHARTNQRCAWIACMGKICSVLVTCGARSHGLQSKKSAVKNVCIHCMYSFRVSICDFYAVMYFCASITL